MSSSTLAKCVVLVSLLKISTDGVYGISSISQYYGMVKYKDI